MTEINEDNICVFCKSKYNKLNNKMCVMCNIVNSNITSKDIFSFIIGNSKLTQIEIIIKTRDYIYKHNKVPLPTDIDKEVQLIKINPSMFIEVFKIMSEKDKLKFKEFKIFFTDDLDIKLLKTLRIFDKVIKNKTEIIYNYELTSKQLSKINKYSEIYIISARENLLNLFINP